MKLTLAHLQAEACAERDRFRELHSQLVNEHNYEQLDSRRINLLKSQNVQLERQVLLQAEALDGRGGFTHRLQRPRTRVTSVSPFHNLATWHRRRNAVVTNLHSCDFLPA